MRPLSRRGGTIYLRPARRADRDEVLRLHRAAGRGSSARGPSRRYLKIGRWRDHERWALE